MTTCGAIKITFIGLIFWNGAGVMLCLGWKLSARSGNPSERESSFTTSRTRELLLSPALPLMSNTSRLRSRAGLIHRVLTIICQMYEILLNIYAAEAGSPAAAEFNWYTEFYRAKWKQLFAETPAWLSACLITNRHSNWKCAATG